MRNAVEIKESIRTIINQLHQEGCPSGDDEILMLDSFTFLHVVIALEETFDITIDVSLLMVENFNTVNKMANMILLL